MCLTWPLLRVWVLTLEATFTYVFWSVHQSACHRDKTVHYMCACCPWDVNDLEYSGLNSHSPLMEGVEKAAFTVEELVALATFYEQKRIAYVKGEAERYAMGRSHWEAIQRGEKVESDLDEEGKKWYRKYILLQAKQAKTSKSRSAYVKECRATARKVEKGEISADDENVRAQLAMAEKARAWDRVASQRRTQRGKALAARFEENPESISSFTDKERQFLQTHQKRTARIKERGAKKRAEQRAERSLKRNAA